MDPVTLAVVRGSFEQIGDEMDLHLIHAAISPIISETNDCANGIFHPETGETIAQGRYGLPVFLAYMQFTVQNIIKVAEAEGGFREGDVWITNEDQREKPHRLLLLVKNKTGYLQLCELLSRAWLSNLHRGRAELRIEWLQQLADDGT